MAVLTGPPLETRVANKAGHIKGQAGGWSPYFWWGSFDGGSQEGHEWDTPRLKKRITNHEPWMMWKNMHDARMHLKANPESFDFFLTQTKKSCQRWWRDDIVQNFSTLRIWTNFKIKSLNQATLKWNPPVFWGFLTVIHRKNAPKPWQTHMQLTWAPREVWVLKMGIPTSCLQSKSNLPSLRWSLFCFRLVRKGKSCFRRSEGKLFTNAEVIFIWKKTFQKCSIICLMKFVITEKDSIRSRRVSSPRIQKHHRICFISLICI